MMNAGRDSRGWEINRLPFEYKPPSSLLLISETLYENSMTPDRSMIALLTRFFWKVLPNKPVLIIMFKSAEFRRLLTHTRHLQRKFFGNVSIWWADSRQNAAICQISMTEWQKRPKCYSWELGSNNPPTGGREICHSKRVFALYTCNWIPYALFIARNKGK